MKERPTIVITIRLTPEERAMLQTLAIRDSTGAMQGLVRKLIRDAWVRRQRCLLSRKKPRRAP